MNKVIFFTLIFSLFLSINEIAYAADGFPECNDRECCRTKQDECTDKNAINYQNCVDSCNASGAITPCKDACVGACGTIRDNKRAKCDADAAQCRNRVGRS